ncbi:hypothetical protein HYH02_012864 [Chlamydomonas schloesseri]|uniref:Uncharacterized protein n=1 Tax=Chlamydomonas schloesseri TaxID=2026947 RepID=A0A835VYL9_9CHLO|nr:hypothetical protein HYH02_012864 [Chlamydomonas schloesseri]|eukprot:KAG2432730.1 hypothetical protein HYH02_012864 [Chlamydomonas schloesseri]
MADAEDDELFKVIRMAPADLHLPLGEHFLKLQAQVKAMAGERTEERTAMAKERIAMAEERIAMSRENTAKALTVAAMATEKADMAMEKAAMFKELLNAREQLVFVLYAVGVNNGRSFLAYLVSKWRMEQLGGSKRKRLVVLKEGLKGRPNLVTCLQQNVPGWTRADDMTEEKKVEGLAANLDALVTHIWNNTSDDGHSFDPGLGLILRRTARNGDMVAALACLAKSMAVQCRIEEHTEDEEDATIEKGNDAPSA